MKLSTKNLNESDIRTIRLILLDKTNELLGEISRSNDGSLFKELVEEEFYAIHSVLDKLYI